MKSENYNSIQLEIIDNALIFYLNHLQKTNAEIELNGGIKEFYTKSIRWKLGALDELTDDYEL